MIRPRTDAFLVKVKESLAKGWAGFRCDGITSSVKTDDWTNFQVYEEQLTLTLPGTVTALCSYNVAEFSPTQLANVADTHAATILKRQSQWYIVGPSARPSRPRYDL